MKRTPRLITLTTLLVLPAAVFAACDGDDDDAASIATMDAATPDADAAIDAADARAILSYGCQTDEDCLANATPICFVTIDAGTALGSCGPDPNEKDANTPCESVSNCGEYQGCGYRIADGCSATTKYCFDPLYLPGRGGASWVFAACGCDGGEVDYGAGNGFDLEHVPAPVVAGVSCEQLASEDAGDAAIADATDDR